MTEKRRELTLSRNRWFTLWSQETIPCSKSSCNAAILCAIISLGLKLEKQSFIHNSFIHPWKQKVKIIVEMW